MGALPEKSVVLAALIARVRRALDSLEASQRAAQAGATHAEARPEHSKDTRAIEGQYLARGLADRAESLREALAALEAMDWEPAAPDAAIAVGSLVSLRAEDDTLAHYFIAPVGGGEKLEFGTAFVQTITPTSPLGRALVGRELGDDVVVRRRREACPMSIHALA